MNGWSEEECQDKVQMRVWDDPDPPALRPFSCMSGLRAALASDLPYQHRVPSWSRSPSAWQTSRLPAGDCRGYRSECDGVSGSQKS